MRTASDDLDEVGGWVVVASRAFIKRRCRLARGAVRSHIPRPLCRGERGVEYDPTLLTFIARDGGWSREEDGGGGLCGKRNGKSQTSSTVVYSFNE